MRKVIDTEAPLDESSISQITPSIGMEFESEDKAYEFYNRYAGQVGFSVRKSSSDKSSLNLTRSRTFVCSREGFRKDKKGAKEVKKPRPETRIGCPARLTIKIMPSGIYNVTEFVAGHNHQPAPPSTSHMLRSQRVFTDLDANVVNSNNNNSDDSCNNSNGNGGNFGNNILGLLGEEYSNVIRVKRMKNMQSGDCGAILKYLMSMQIGNPNFYYGVQVDEDDKLTNIFWSDEKMREDFRVFGDVVCFDVSYKVNSRPLVLFLGVNNHKQVCLFGAGFIYDESFESYKWLFETFNFGMKMKGKNGKKNVRTILSDNNLVVINAISIVYPRANFRVCIWHVYQNSCKQLNHIFQGSKTFSKDFAKCIYECETEEEFINSWRNMVEKYDLINNEYLIKLFNEKHIWAEPYSRDIFTADIKSALQTETLTNNLKKHLNPQMDLFSYFKHFERALEENRYSELQADFNASQSFPRIPQSKLLKQAANFYTPNIFEIFRKEFEMFVDSVLFTCNNNNKETFMDYRVGVMDTNSEQFVRFEMNSNESNNERISVFCSCKKFEYMGIVCCHLLKVLDFRNIKELPKKYFLKRWGKNARVKNNDDDDDVSDEVAVALISVPMSQHEELVQEQETHHFFNHIAQDHAGPNYGHQGYYVGPQLHQGYSMQGILQSQQFLGNSPMHNGNHNSNLH